MLSKYKSGQRLREKTALTQHLNSFTFRIRLLALADEHVNASKDYVVDSDYSGSHWLASFLFYSLDRREDALEAMRQ